MRPAMCQHPIDRFVQHRSNAFDTMPLAFACSSHGSHYICQPYA